MPTPDPAGNRTPASDDHLDVAALTVTSAVAPPALVAAVPVVTLSRSHP